MDKKYKLSQLCLLFIQCAFIFVGVAIGAVELCDEVDTLYID